MLNALVRTSPQPDSNFFEWVQKLNENTPDAAELNRKDKHRMFVFDDMMVGRKDYNTCLNRHSEFLNKAYTLGDHYRLFKNNLGRESHLLLFEDKGHAPPESSWCEPQRRYGAVQTAPTASVRGELHAVHPYQIINLDKRFENGYTFDRIRIDVIVPFVRMTWSVRDHRYIPETIGAGEVVQAWTYVARRTYWDNLLDGGFQFQPIRCFNPKSTKTGAQPVPFYFYTANQ